MTSRMIDRVARAIYDATPFKQTEGGYDEQSETYRRMCELLARAAIAAMREPTDEMIRAAYGNERRGTERGNWKAMIDEALR